MLPLPIKSPTPLPARKTPAMISVIIPTFNRAALLPRAVTSVLAQSYKDIELIVVDDGSTDDTAELPLLANPRITYLALASNRGVSAARNHGIACAHGAWVAFLDSDDEWKPQKLQRQMAWLESHPQYRIMQCLEIWVRNGVRVNPPQTHHKVAGDIFLPSLQRCMVTPSSVLLQRSLLEEQNGFDESLPACEDYDLWLRICASYPVGLLEELLLIRYGGHSDQLSSIIPRLDQYRIRSMRALLDKGTLSTEKQAQLQAEFLRKVNYMAQGSLKSNNMDDYTHYTALQKQYAHD